METMENITQISWKHNRTIFSFNFSKNKTSSNFTSQRMSISPTFPTELTISNVQQEDEGLYVCDVTGSKGVRTIQWNLTVLKTSKGKIEHKAVQIISTPGTVQSSNFMVLQ